ncbi:MAG: menaquinone biosynthesis protein [Bacteroidetes bacterium]|nr:menaquinone biosynthesis protein [Bacteroidota bacterium]HET6245023.1 menaquinone biosynthesis protein [Bacteroidia bacterium]
MISKIKISVVSYLNSKPFIYGIQDSPELKKHDFELQLDLPAQCAEKLINGKVDIGLVPVIVIPKLKESYIISEFCIGANGPVKTVMLYSEVPVKEIKQIYLDYQSKSSVMLTRILASELWDINPQWIPALNGYENLISKTTAAVVIGDRAFEMNGKYKYEYDLSEQWQILTGMPFVFACWVANKKLPDDFVRDFNHALKHGLENLEHVANLHALKNNNLLEYFTKHIKYEFDKEKKDALALFLHKASEINLL